jgi:hypothetical protein
MGSFARQRIVQGAGVFAALLMLGTTPQAQTSQHLGTPEEQKACDADARRHCRTVLDKGDMTVLACLRQHQTKLSRACRAVLTGQREQ